MVVGETNVTTTNQVPKASGVSQDKIDNIMGGISNTGAVKMNNHRKKLRQRFDIIKKLGQGTYGKVQLGINKETGQEVAIKTIKKCKIEAEADLIRIRREVQIMSSVQHPNIIHIYEVFENREKMVLVMEFAAGGELYDYLSERKVLAEEEARRIFRQVSTAVYYCHKHKICHRDLKLENILLDENGNAKIADFGLSNVFDDQRLLATFCGSPLYASPEIVKGTPYQGPEVDCWSLGVLLYTLVYGSMPFDGSNFKRLVKQISQGDYYEPKKPSRASPLIREMLTVCPQKRATIEQICNHWWVNEGYKESCLDLAEDLANQTPVRLDVLLSLSPTSITADQLVVPSADSKANERVPRSHSVGSIRDMGNTEAERRILDMVAAGGEAALMPSPTRTITPAHSPIQSKRKLETTVSTENAIGAKKKERPADGVENNLSKRSIAEMEVDQDEVQTKLGDLEKIENICEELITQQKPEQLDDKPVKEKTLTKLDSVEEAEEIAEEINPTKVIKKFVNKHKTADLVAAINKISPEKPEDMSKTRAQSTRKNSLPDDNLGKFTERRRSRILETAERFQNMGNANNEKPKKIMIPGVSVGSFKKEFERKASLTGSNLTPAERRSLDKKSESTETSPDKSSIGEQDQSASPDEKNVSSDVSRSQSEKVETSDSKNSLVNFSLEEARRSMENSIALLNQAKDETSKEVDQLCAKTENVVVSEAHKEREKKLKNAREIIGNAIQPGGRLCMGVRKPPVPFGINGRSISGSVVPSVNIEKRPSRQTVSESSTPELRVFEKEPLSIQPEPVQPQPSGGVKTSRAEITLKSATLPRRKTAKTEIQLDIKPRIVEQPMRFSTEMQHQVPDLRSAPVKETPYSPITNSIHTRATSLEPQTKEHIIPIQRPPTFTRSGSNSARSGTLSRQSTNESDTDTNQSQTTISGSSQPIKKSPREFIIPIAVEGGGFITPRSGSVEPTDSSHTTSSTFSRIGKPRRMGSLLTEADSEDESPFQKLRTTSMNRDGDSDEPRFSLHRLRSTRPTKKLSQDTNDSQSSGEDDDEDGFEILTAENLFSTLLQRVRALTNRLNVNNDITSGFSNSRLLNNMRQTHSPFWNQEPFGSRLNNNAGAPWRRSFSRDIGPDMDSMFSRTGATLPRGKNKLKNRPILSDKEGCLNENVKEEEDEEAALDLADLDLSRLRLTKKDLETLSNITPGLPKCFQEQLLAKLPPTQARKLSRTLSMQNNALTVPVKVYKRSHSGGRELGNSKTTTTTITTDNKALISDTVKEKETLAKQNDSSREESSDRSSAVYRRSTSRGRFDYTDTDTKSRSTSVCKNSDDYSKSLCSSYSSDISDKYKYYSPYLGKKGEKTELDCPVLSCKAFNDSQETTCLSPTKEVYGRPPSGCLSPPPCTPDNSLRRRSSQRRISRFLRPDFFDPPQEENAYLREKKQRERETQSVLREIREKSRERNSKDRKSQNGFSDDENNLEEHRPDKFLNQDKKNVTEGEVGVINLRHVRNKSLERFCDAADGERESVQLRRRSLSRSRDLADDKSEYIDKNAIADKILQELQILSAAKSKHEQIEKVKKLDNKDKENVVKIKTKSKEKIAINNSSLDASKCSSSTINKKVTKLKKTKKTDNKDVENNDNLKLELPKVVEPEKLKKESKLMRPKSYPSKEPDNLSVVVTPPNDIYQEKDGSNKSNDSDHKEFRIVRPKSFPNSKLTQPKEMKKSNRSNVAISVVVDKLIEKDEKTIQLKAGNSKSNIPEIKSTSSKSSDSSSAADTKGSVKKVVKVVKKVKSESSEEKLPIKTDKQPPSSNIPQPKEKSPEKKVGKGLLYAIGLKFEKLRENAKNKEKKLTTSSQDGMLEQKGETVTSEPLEKPEKGKNCLKKKKSKSTNSETVTDEKQNEKMSKVDKKSRIDSMIKSLRERSVTRAPVMTESGLIKRAVSVEDMSGVFHKTGVNKVLGLFKKIEKDASERKVMSTRSTSNIERQIKDSGTQKDRPKSGGFVSTLRKCPALALNKDKDKCSTPSSTNSDSKTDASNTITDNIPQAQNKCPDCGQKQEIIPVKKADIELKPSVISEKDITKDKRKELSLDFSKLDNSTTKHRNYYNGNLINNYSNIPYGSYNNNNNFYIGFHEINRNNLLTPSNENITNYSSDSRSPHDDCASSSTFLSPSDEPELCFDNWSVCSEDNFISTPSPTVSRLSRASQISSPTTQESQPESVIDRIKRKSFYCRFNEKKPKRQSSIVGPAARDFYRESAAKLRSRPPDRVVSPEIEPIRSSHEYFKPLKLSTAATDLKPPHFKSNIEYSKPRKSLNDIYPPPTCSKRFTDNDYSRSRTGGYDTSSSYYNTLNPQRRSSFTLNGVSPSVAGNIEGYATLGRRTRPYDHRSFTTLESGQGINTSPTVGAFRRDQRTPTEFGNLPRSNMHYRNPSVPRSPTNI